METITTHYSTPYDFCTKGEEGNGEKDKSETWVNLKQVDLQNISKTCADKLKSHLITLGQKCKEYQTEKAKEEVDSSGKRALSEAAYKDQQAAAQRAFDTIKTSLKNCIQSEQESECTTVFNGMSPKYPPVDRTEKKKKENAQAKQEGQKDPPK